MRGGGTNSAPINFSAYTTSKIALIKTVELLDAEFEDISFTIIGPGWVKTKIHQQTIREELKGLASYKETIRRLEENDFVKMERVVESVKWVLSEKKEVVGGRNFSTAHDMVGSKELREMLLKNKNAYKLRRNANDF